MITKSLKHKKVVLLEPQNCVIYELENYETTIKKDHKYSKKHLYISYLPDNLITNISLQIDKKLENSDELELVMIEKVQDELRLKPDKEIMIRYVPKKLNYDNTKIEYELFLIEIDTIIKRFKECIQKYPFIDFIIPTQFLFLALYYAKILPKNGVHAFVYFGYESSFFVVYESEKLAYYRHLNITLYNFFEIFKFTNKSDTSDSFISTTNDSLTSNSSCFTNQSSLLNNEFLSKINSIISDLLVYTNRALNIYGFDAFYLDCDSWFDDSLYKAISDNFGINCLRFDFNYGFCVPKDMTHLKKLALLLGKELEKGHEIEFNYTIFEKPKPFLKRDSGQLISVAIISFILAFSYPLYLFLDGKQLNIENERVQKEIDNLAIEHAILNSQIATLNSEKERLLSEYKKTKESTEGLRNILFEIYRDQESYLLKTELILELVEQVLKHNVKIEKINLKSEINENKNSICIINISLYSNDHNKITKFIKELVDSRKYHNISVNNIYHDSNSSKFTSNINIIIR